jgi:hypothetical protein
VLSKCVRVAVVTALAFTAAAPARAAVKSWSLASDFAVAPDQANPNPDSYGNASVWSFRQSATLAHAPANYTLLPTFIPNVAGVAGLNAWQRSDVVDDTSLPSVGFNSLATDAFPNGLFRYPSHTILVHPYESRLAVVAWQSPVSGTVKVTGGIIDRHAGCGDGVNWSVDKGGATLASGAVGDGGSQAFSGAGLSSIAVAPGDFLYFVVGPGAGTEYHCDSTGLDVTIEHPLAGGETVTTLDASATPSVSGQPVAFTATVAGANPGAPPAGAIQFKVDGANAGTPVALDLHGTAVYSTGALTVGTHTVTAVFQPSGVAVDPSRAVVSQRVDKASTTTAVFITPNPSVAGQDATFSATVSAAAPGNGTPTGTVQFTESDGTPIGPPQTLAAGRATLVASADAGSYTVRANYSGDADFIASSGSVGQTVTRANTTTAISSDTNPVSPGGKVTFTVTVATIPPGAVQPAGTIAILVDGENVSGPVPLFDDGPTAAGVEITFTAPSAPRSDTIGAVYSGDWNTNPSSSRTFVQTVAAPAAATTPTPTSAPSTRSNPTTAATTTAALSAMTAPLTQALKRKGFAALNGTTETLMAAGPGTLTQRLYTPTAPKSAATSKRKPVLIASGRHTFAAAGEGKLTLQMTAAGRRAIRHAKSLNVEIVTRFAAPTGAPLIAVKRLTVKAHTARPARAATRRGTWTLTRIRR